MIVAWVAVALIGSALGAWLVWSVLDRPLSSTPDREEIAALDSRLKEIRSGIGPIAISFSAETTSDVIDVADYRIRVRAVRSLVDSTNGMAASSPEALEIRDLIVTGGAQVLDGFDGALDALASNDASAATSPASLVDEGIAALQDAQDKIDALLGGS